MIKKVNNWRAITKKRMLDSFGGKCGICGYDKSDWALAFHHIDPNEKEFSFSKYKLSPNRWDIIAKELRKCVLVCHNCHSEIHQGMTEIPENISRFNEEYAVHPEIKIDKGNRVDWSSINLEKELKYKSYTEIGKMVGCVGNTVKRRAKKMNLI